MRDKQYNFGKFPATFLFILGTLLFSGCGSLVKITEFSTVDVSLPGTGVNISYGAFHSTLEKTEKPGFVEEPVKPDKTLYNPMVFASIDGFTKTNVLIKNSYFTYDLLTKTDWKALDELTEPTNISITLYNDFARTSWKYRESAFIYKIEEDYIYLGTAGHCAAKSSKYLKNAVIMLYDRTEINVDLSTCEIGGKFHSDVGDYAMFRIPTSSIPYDELVKLKQVTFSKSAVDNAKAGDYIYSGNIYAQNTKKDFDKKVMILGEGHSLYENLVKVSSIQFSDAYYITEGYLVDGQSGSAMFDKYGNVVGTCSGMYGIKKQGVTYKAGVFTKLTNIDKLYQKLKDK